MFEEQHLIVKKLEKDLFFALKGSKLNGEHYIQDAINHGAIAIVCSETCKFKSNKIFIIRTGDIRKYLSNF